jgi:hypothetical protein
MEQNQTSDENILARWNYTREEWRKFTRWDRWRRGFFGFLINFLNGHRFRKVPGVVITGNSVYFDNRAEPFHQTNAVLRRVDIADSGPVNVLEIIYERQTNRGLKVMEIMVPVPKGKLREAVAVQEKLQEAFGV